MKPSERILEIYCLNTGINVMDVKKGSIAYKFIFNEQLSAIIEYLDEKNENKKKMNNEKP